jgi:phenylpyruvate tautomerase PptA (4-oxalocrotonate tautomerase family)
MPILNVEIVTSDPIEAGLTTRIAEVAGQVFGGPAGSTWVRLRALPPEQYAENGTTSPAGWHAVFVTVLKAQRPSGPVLQAEVRALTDGIAHVCGRPAENVHILYEPDARGRIAFGGEVKS